MEEINKHQFKILSLDGGGIKGIIPCIILRYIEEKTGKPVSSLFDLIAGTSTGGIIALGLTKPKEDVNEPAFKAEQMLGLYVDHGKEIFSQRREDWLSRLGSITNTTKILTKGVYGVQEFEKLLDQKFGSELLAEALTNVLVTTYALEKEKPFYFSSRLAKIDEKENYSLSKIARSTSAAPTYFAPSLVSYDEDKNMAMVDGGVFANNPSILAYCEAKELWKEKIYTGEANEKEKGFDVHVKPDNNDLPFFMLSISCGHMPTTIDFKSSAEWRTAQWIQPLLRNVFMQSVAASTHYTMQHLMPPYEDKSERYIRLEEGIDLRDANSEMDDVSPENIEALKIIGNRYVANNKETLDRICGILK